MAIQKQNSFIKNFNYAVLRFFLMVFGGGFSVLILPPFSHSAVGYVALVLSMAYLFYKPRTKKEMFWLSYVLGAAFFVVGFAWISNALLVDADKLANFIPLVFFAVGAFFGLFWAIPAVIVARQDNIYCRMIGFVALYVLMEWVRSFIFTGFPWNLLGTAFSFDYRLIQGAAYIGTYGLSLLLLLMCCGVVLFLLSILQRRFYKGSPLLLFLPMLFIYGASFRTDNHYDGQSERQDNFTVRLVQPNIPQTFKWDPKLLEKNFHQYIDMTKNDLGDVRLVVWGETATPYFLDRDEKHLEEIKGAIPKNGFLVTGVLRLAMEQGEIVPYNSLFVLDDEGNIKDYYDKAHLVPFGEYLPFRKYLPDFMKPVADIVGDLGKGEKYKNIKVQGLPIMGGAICYESIFPKEVLNAKEKPEILLVLANDGWYGISAGPYQHLAAAQMRAVEEGVTVVRSANTGISAVIDANGQILGKIDLDRAAVIDISLVRPYAKETFYGRLGNSIPLGLILVILLVCFYPVRGGFKGKKNT